MQYKNLQKIKNNKGFPGSETWRSTKCVLAKAKTSPSSTTGFVILFAVTLSSILLAIALGVANIALKEVKFGTNARDTNNAFFAADTGIELALFNDKSSSSIYPAPGFWNFVLSGLGSSGQGCAIVTVDKTVPPATKIISKGYNDGGASCTQGSNSVERQLEVNY